MKYKILLFTLLNLLVLTLWGQTGPENPLTSYSTGDQKDLHTNFYGTTFYGGANNMGCIFKTRSDGTGIVNVHSFDAQGGNSPYGGLTEAQNGRLYGLTYAGGSANSGVLYEFDPVEEKYNRKADFTGSNGILPAGELIQAEDGCIYGLAVRGGDQDRGTLFRYDIARNKLTKLWDFKNADGIFPYGGIIETAPGVFYGMTSEGGAYNKGTIFKFTLADSNLVPVAAFDSVNTGYGPRGSLIEYHGRLFGLTYGGGSNKNGVLFEYDPSTGSLTKRVDFENITRGRYPYGSLTVGMNNKLYGITFMGGVNGDGVIFEYDPDAHTITKKIDIAASGLGRYSMNSLMQASDGLIYGISSTGGVNNMGVIYAYDPLNNTLQTTAAFNGTNGSSAQKIRLIEVNIALAPMDSLRVCYKLNGNTADSSSHGYHGINHGGVSVADRFGNPNKAYSFNGTDQYIEMPAAPTSGISKFTFLCWIKTTESRSNNVYWNRPCIFANSTSGATSSDFGISTNNGFIGIWSGLNTAGDNSAFSNYPINDNQWHFIACTYDHDSIRLYVDGKDIHCKIRGTKSLNSYAFYLMAQHYYSGNASYYHQGTLDEVRLYNRVLNLEEINYFYSNHCAAALPATADVSHIGEGTIILEAHGGQQYRWYHVPFGGSSLGMDEEYTTPYLAKSDTLWVANYNGCESARARAIANICRPDTGLVAYYPFSGNSKDYSGNHLDATAHGSAFIPDQYGNPASAAELMNSDTLVVAGNALLDITQTITLCAWIKVSAFNNYGGFITYGSDDHEIYSVSTTSDNRVFFQTNWPGTVYNVYTTALETDKWYYIAASFNKGLAKIYVNGVLNNTATLSISEFTLSDNRYLTMGMSQPGADEYFKGDVDEVRIYNRVLSDAEIVAIYSNPCLSSRVVVDAGTDQEVRSGSEIVLNATGNASSFSWDQGVINNTEFTITASKNFVVTATDVNECTAIDTVYIKVVAHTGVNENDLSDAIKIYPTITGSLVHIESTGHSVHGVCLYNTRGGLVYSTDSETETIDLGDLPEGIYLLRVTTAGEPLITKIIKTR
jgi:uncharacterized repeat protein (TIGR03803 family)